MGNTYAPEPQQNRLAEVASLFLRLGFTAFGGPAAHIAMMRQEIVQRRKWISDERFMDLMGIVNLIPGPNSTELVISLGYLRAGWPGLLIAGLCFIVPAMLIVLAFAWLYVEFGTLPQVGWLFYGIKPIVIAIIAQALLGLSRTVLKGTLPIIMALLVLVADLLGGNQLLLLATSGLIFVMVRWWVHRQKKETVNSILPFSLASLSALWKGASLATPVMMGAVATNIPVSLLTLFLTFLKIGSVLYGSGYVLLAFLHTDFVQNLGWITDQQLLAAISVGQFTPGPVFTTATFIGYLVARVPGALVATAGIFLPSFLFVALIHPLADKLRRSPWSAALLDGVNVASLALMGSVLIQLGQSTLIDVLTWLIALLAFAILLRFKINAVWLILAGAIVGIVRFWLG
jgi:chromate transporter